MCGAQGSDLPFWGPCLLRKATEVLAALTMDAQQNFGSRLSRKGLVRLRQTSARPRRVAPANRRGLHLCIGEGRECSTSRCRIRLSVRMVRNVSLVRSLYLSLRYRGWCIVGRGSRVRLGRGARIQFSPGARLIIGGHRWAPSPKFGHSGTPIGCRIVVHRCAKWLLPSTRVADINHLPSGGAWRIGSGLAQGNRPRPGSSRSGRGGVCAPGNGSSGRWSTARHAALHGD